MDINLQIMCIQERFIRACSEGKLKRVRKILNNRILNSLNLINLNKNGKTGVTPLFAALIGRHDLIVKLLIDSGADVNKGGPITPLMISCLIGDLDIIYLLIISGAKIDTKDSQGETALMYAANSRKDFEQFKQIARIFFIAIKDGDKIPDSEIKQIWEKIKDYYERKERLSRGSEATCKGSIGHDKLNVITLNKKDWEEQIQIFSKNYDVTKERVFATLV